MAFCTQCGKQSIEGQACECTAVKRFCTQCGSPLSEGKACECTAVKRFCTQCGNTLPEGETCPCTTAADTDITEAESEAPPINPAEEQESTPEWHPNHEPDPSPEWEPIPEQDEEWPEQELIHEWEPHPEPYPEAEQYDYTEKEPEPYYAPEPEQYEDPEPHYNPEPKPHYDPPPRPTHNTYVEKPTIVESVAKRMEISEPTPAGTQIVQIVPDCIGVMEGEVPIRQYGIANLRNLLRLTRADGRIQVTNKRVIYRAEGRSMGKRTVAQHEYNINEVTGIEAVSHCRFSLLHTAVGLITVAAAAAIMGWIVLLFSSHWGGRVHLPWFLRQANEFIDRQGFIAWARAWFIDGQGLDVSSISLIVGLVAGFGGIVLFFLLRGKFWLKLVMTGISLGGFVPVALADHIYSSVLLGISLLIAILGLVLFSRVPELVVSLHGKNDFRVVLVRARRRLAGMFHEPAGIGYAEAAPAPETEAAIDELGAIIRDVQAPGDTGVEKWSM